MAGDVVKQIRKATRCKFTSEEKIRIVLEGLRCEIPVTELCRRDGIAPSLYYHWSKAFIDAGKNGLVRDASRDATSSIANQFAKTSFKSGGIKPQSAQSSQRKHGCVFRALRG